MQRGLGGAGSALTAGAAVLLTVGTTNAYVAGATRLAGALVADGSMPRAMARPGAPLAVIAAASVGHPRRAGRGARRRRPDRARDLDLLRRGLRRRHGRRGAAARRAPARCGGAVAGARGRRARLLGPLRGRARGSRAARARVRQCPCGWRSLAGIFSRSWLSCSAIARRGPGRAGMEAEREAPAVGRDGGDVDRDADVGTAAEEAGAELGELEAQLRGAGGLRRGRGRRSSCPSWRPWAARWPAWRRSSAARRRVRWRP